MLIIRGNTGVAVWRMQAVDRTNLAARCVNDGFLVNVPSDPTDAQVKAFLEAIFSHTAPITGAPQLALSWEVGF